MTSINHLANMHIGALHGAAIAQGTGSTQGTAGAQGAAGAQGTTGAQAIAVIQGVANGQGAAGVQGTPPILVPGVHHVPIARSMPDFPQRLPTIYRRIAISIRCGIIISSIGGIRRVLRHPRITFGWNFLFHHLLVLAESQQHVIVWFEGKLQEEEDELVLILADPSAMIPNAINGPIFGGQLNVINNTIERLRAKIQDLLALAQLILDEEQREERKEQINGLSGTLDTIAASSLFV